MFIQGTRIGEGRYLEPYTDWHISVSIGRLNFEVKWNGQKAY